MAISTHENQSIHLQRTDIPHRDVFISWTGADRELKDTLVHYLQNHGIDCLESDSECCGNFEKWSKDAVHKGSIFVLLFTPNSLKKARSATEENPDCIALEINEQRTLVNYCDRFLPLCTDLSLLKDAPWVLPEKCSACLLDDTQSPSEAVLAEVLHKIQNLLIDHAFTIYRECNKPNPIELIPLYRTQKSANAEYSFSQLYIPRTLTQSDPDGNPIQTNVTLSEEDLNGDILFIGGGAGSGKSRYLEYLSAELAVKHRDILAITVSCRSFLGEAFDLVDAMHQAFIQKCGIGTFYTRMHFENLLTSGCRLLLILDGLDEIPNFIQTNQFISAVKQSIYTGNAIKNPTLLFTSRNFSDAKRISAQDRSLRCYRMDPFTEEDIRQLCQNLFLLFNTPDNQDSFYLQLSDLDEEIRTNPLLLSQLAIVYQEQGNIPQTAVEIYDAIFSIYLGQDSHANVQVPPLLESLVSKGQLSAVLQQFARMRYESLSRGEYEDILDIFCCILEDDFGRKTPDAAEALIEYLQNRAILVADEFYHKMFLEYFTAVSFYDSAFGYQKNPKNLDTVTDLFSHYNDPYWSAVIQLFLVKADSKIGSNSTKALYQFLIPLCGDDFTLLFDTCRELLRHKQVMQFVLTEHILLRSADGTYPAYGPLFWYVPEYDLYEAALLALAQHTDSPDYSKMLALTRDVCFIFGQKNTVSDFTGQVNPLVLWQKANLTGVRKALCEIFCTGKTDFDGGADIYPRCFNVAEAKAFLQSDCGITGRMQTPFADELGLYSHEFVPVMGDYNIGFAALSYHIPQLESLLNRHSCRKLRGLALAPTEFSQMEYMSFNSSHLAVCYLPENISWDYPEWRQNLPLQLFSLLEDTGLQYIRRWLRGLTSIPEQMFLLYTRLQTIQLPPEVTTIGFEAFSCCWSLSSVVLPDGLQTIEPSAFAGCSALPHISLPGGLKAIESNAFAGCSALTSIRIPDSVTSIERGAFRSCCSLTEVFLPRNLESIAGDTFEKCYSLRRIHLPDRLQHIDSEAFFHCHHLTDLQLPDGLKTIGWNAFWGCNELASVYIPDSVTEIGHDAFGHCGELNLQLPSHLESQRKHILCDYDYDLDPTLDLPHLPRPIFDIEETPSVEPTDHTLIIGRLGVSKFIPIPENVTCALINQDNITYRAIYDQEVRFSCLIVSEGITEISALALMSRSDLTSLHLPGTLKTIGQNAFIECTGLQKLHLPEGLAIIESGAFQRCIQLQKVHLPASLQTLGDAAFAGCWNLTDIELPEGLDVIRWKSFECCHSLTQITVPEGVTEIEEFAFEKCDHLTCVTLPASLRKVGSTAFVGCTSITEVTIGKRFEEELHNIFPDANPKKVTFI